MTSEKQAARWCSALYDAYKAEGAHFASVEGYQTAMQVSGPAKEYNAIRSHLGITDRSDMGKFRLSGNGSLELIQELVAGNVDSLAENALRYTLMLDSVGRIVADVQVYCDFNEYIVTCDGTLRDAVWERLQGHAESNVVIDDFSERYAAVAVEGPYSWRILQQLIGTEGISLRPANFMHSNIGETDVMLSRFGSTGEYGYLFFLPRDAAPALLRQIREVDSEVVLCGRKVHDLLRLEVRSFNFAQDIPRGETPLQAGLHWMIDFRKKSFVGRDAVMEDKSRGLDKKLVALKFFEDGEPTPLGGVYDGPNLVGYVANSGYSRRIRAGVCLAYLNAVYAWVGIELKADTKAGPRRAKTVSSPFFATKSTKVQIA